MTDDTVCPCGSGLSFALCCGPALSGQRPAETAEALMRSRYTAYVRGDVGYLKASWHPSTCPPDLSLDNQPVWEKLDIVRCEAGGVADEEGRVEFVAHFRDKTGSGRVPELSRFVREQGSWFYLDGVQPPTLVNKTGRNAPCPCGSGRKFKQCCGR